MNDDRNNREKRLLAVRFCALPALLLTPFWLVGYTAATCYGVMASNAGIAGGQRTAAASALQAAANPKIFGITFWLIVIGFLIASLVQIGNQKYRLRFANAKRQFQVALASAVFSGLAYITLYQFSQWKYPPNWYCGADHVLHGGLSNYAHVGLGLAPVAALVVIVVYLLAPLTALLVTKPSSKKLWQAN